MTSSSPSPEDRRDRVTCAQVLEDHRHAIAEALIENLCLLPRWQLQRPVESEEFARFVESEGYALVDYLSRWLRADDDLFKHLYVGERLKQLYEEHETEESPSRVMRRKILSADLACLKGFVRDEVSERAVDRFVLDLEAVHRLLLAEADKTLDVLFIGDCIHLDIMAFIAGPCMEEGIALRPCFSTSKNPAELGRHLRSLSDRHFDAVFYSPLSYEFDIEYTQLLRPSSAFVKANRIDAIVDTAIDSIGTQLDLIEDLFDCPIHVHNTANILREGNSFKRHIKGLITRRTRRRAGERLDEWLRNFIRTKNDRSFEHLFLIDELELAQPFSQATLGAYFYKTGLQHPCRFSQVIASHYVDLLTVHAHLLGKKLIVCDLDNTLWKGIIGEGAIEPHRDRQSSLLDLKSRGIVLSINSKNSPENVHFEDGPIEEDDFVYADIDWEPKVNGLRRTELALNLKARDFVFIDDRADEREMSVMAFPDLVALDPCVDRTWRLFRLWYEMLDPALTSDRTGLYHAREARREFLQTEDVESNANNALFQSLDLCLTLREAGSSDLKRVHELINRTNQFNLCGTRVTFAEVERWSLANDALLLLADARDRFGDMGTVGILVLARGSDCWEIPVFVLSCRVFGYGIERAMLNRIKLWVQKRTESPDEIVGEYRETGRNQPCSAVYSENEFALKDGKWISESPAVLPDADWLTIESDL